MFNHSLQSGKAQMAETEQAPLPPYTQNALITRRVSRGGSRGFKSLSEREEIVGKRAPAAKLCGRSHEHFSAHADPIVSAVPREDFMNWALQVREIPMPRLFWCCLNIS